MKATLIEQNDGYLLEVILFDNPDSDFDGITSFAKEIKTLAELDGLVLQFPSDGLSIKISGDTNLGFKVVQESIDGIVDFDLEIISQEASSEAIEERRQAISDNNTSIYLLYDLIDAMNANVKIAPVEEVNRLGIKYKNFIPMPSLDSVRFEDCSGIPENLPEYISVSS